MSSSLFVGFDLGSDPSQILLGKTAKFVAVPASLFSSLMRKRFQPRIQILEQRAYHHHFLHCFAGHTTSGEAAHPKLKQVIMRQLVARVHGNLYLIQQIVRNVALLLKFLPELSRCHPEERLHLLPSLVERHLLWRFGLVDLNETHQGKLEELDTEHSPTVLGEHLQILLRNALFAHLTLSVEASVHQRYLHLGDLRVGGLLKLRGGEAADGQEAIETAKQLGPDVVLMDIRMPILDGLAATRRIVTGPDSRPRVLILTTFDLDEYVYEALRSGASGFMLKDNPADQLITAIRVVAAGEALLAPQITRRLISEFARRSPSTARPEQLQILTDRETEVLKLVAHGLSNSEIASELHVAETTVRTHVGHLLTKLELRDRVQAVVLAYESGLIRARPAMVAGVKSSFGEFTFPDVG